MQMDALRLIRSSLERWSPLEQGGSVRVLPLGVPALDSVLPQRGLVHGTVTELQVQGASGAATSFALCVCRAAQFRSRPRSSGGGSASSQWCAYVDPSATLFAPGVARLGVDLTRLLVVQPEVDAVSRVAVRIAEANIASVLVIDLSSPVERLTLDDPSWQRTVRRLSLAVKSTATTVLLITRAEQFQSLPLPSFLRLEFTRRSAESFEIRVGKDRTGRISAPQSIALSALDPVRFEPDGADAADSADSADAADAANGRGCSGLTVQMPNMRLDAVAANTDEQDAKLYGSNLSGWRGEARARRVS